MNTLVIHSWDPSNPKLWLFTLTDDGRLRHRFWSGKTWGGGPAVFDSPLKNVAGGLTGRYVSDTEWHVFARGDKGQVAHWYWNASKHSVSSEVL